MKMLRCDELLISPMIQKKLSAIHESSGVELKECIGDFCGYILNSFPNLVIEQSADCVQDIVAYRVGNFLADFECSQELARSELYAGYLESPVEYVKNVLYEMGCEIGTYDAYCYYEKCEDIIEKYPFGDTFVGEPKEDEMFAEIRRRLLGEKIVQTGIDNHLWHLCDLLQERNVSFDLVTLIDTYKKVRYIYLKYRSEKGVDDVENFDDRDRLETEVLIEVLEMSKKKESSVA